jgi:glycosyltransferase involved in cell wall biosynthesis
VKTAVFDVVNPSKAAIVGPVVHHLATRHGIRSVALGSSEASTGRASEADEYARYGLDLKPMLPAPVSNGVRDVDWYLGLVWLRRAAGRILERHRASIFITLNDRTFPHHFFLDAARARGLPTVLLQEALRKDELVRLPLHGRVRRLIDRRLFGIDSRLKMYGQGGCRYVAAWGASSREYFERVGVPAERIAVTGNPAFDAIATGGWRSEAEHVPRRLGFADGDPILVFLTSRVGEHDSTSRAEVERRLRWLFTELGRLIAQHGYASLRVVVKIKPEQTYLQEYYERLAADAGLGPHVRIVGDFPLYPLLGRCAAAVMFSTTAGLEAALLGAPLGILDVSVPMDDWGFVANGVASSISHTADLHAFVAAATSSAQRPMLVERTRKAADRYAAQVGCSTERVSNLIAAAVEARSPREPTEAR